MNVVHRDTPNGKNLTRYFTKNSSNIRSPKSCVKSPKSNLSFLHILPQSLKKSHRLTRIAIPDNVPKEIESAADFLQLRQ
jgi:hypothetical protein